MGKATTYRIKNRKITSSCNFVISLAITHDLQIQMRARKINIHDRRLDEKAQEF